MKFKGCRVCFKKERQCCWKTNPCISKREVPKIKKEVKWLKVFKQGKLYRFAKNGERCPFISKTGCTLKNKPLACDIHPFLPTKWGWIVRTHCPYWNRFTKRDLERVKKEFDRRKSDWTDKIKFLPHLKK